MPTPEQWDPVPHFKERKRIGNGLTAFCDYPDYKLSYRLEVQPEGGGFRVAVPLHQPLPPALEVSLPVLRKRVCGGYGDELHALPMLQTRSPDKRQG